ncbi:MAG: ABC transporter permease [Lachnospiraceae bacterium]
MRQILQTLTNRSFRQNRGRNVVAVLAVVLTTMMFTALFTLAQSMGRNMTEMYLRQSGTKAHAGTKQITDEQITQLAAHPDIVHFGKSIVLGTVKNPCLAGRQVELRYGSDQYARDVFAYPTTGRMPEQRDEIALDTQVLARLDIALELGQSVTLEWENGTDTFTLCGWWEGNLSSYADMAWVSEIYALEACESVPVPKDGQMLGMRMMGITFSDTKNIDAKTQKVLRESGLTELSFQTNLAYTPEVQSSILMENLPMYGGMVLVFLAGYLMIYNVFQISVAADIQFYGKLKTLGTTKKQLKKVVYGQGNRLSAIGIPMGLVAGYVLGVLLVPVWIPMKEMQVVVSASPVIFAGSALFSYVTVLVSCMLPARMAGKVSPIEALRYTDSSVSCHKKKKKSRNGAFLLRMAWSNLWRSRKRTIVGLCSLTLGLVLMSYFYAKNASFDVEKYLMDLTVADYQIDDATNDASSFYDPAGNTISDTMLAEIMGLGESGGVEATGRLYSRQEQMTLGEQTKRSLKAFYNEERLADFASYDPSFPEWKAGFDAAVGGEKCMYTIYGADGLVLDAAADNRYILDGAFDAERFATGQYCLSIGPSMTPGDVIPAHAVGEKLLIEGREFEVMAALKPLRPMVAGRDSLAFDLPVILPADVFTKLWAGSNLRKFYFNVTDETMEDAQALLSKYQQGAAAGMNVVSRRTMIAQYESQTRASAVMGYAVSIIIALVGVLNFVNSMVTAIIARRREFALIQSVGMTKRQLRQMLAFEGLFYAGLTLLAAYTLGALSVGVFLRAMVTAADGYSTFHFTLFPLVCCTPVLIATALLIPYLCFRKLEH